VKRKAVAAVVAATAGAAAAGVIVSRVRAGAAGPVEPAAGVQLERLSKAELYRRAQAADIPGRSGMSKQQLARALRAAGA
jgi:DNA end-binding protein Ku